MLKNIALKKFGWFLLVSCLIPKLGWSQYAIKLDGSNTFKHNQSYMIDIAVKPKVKTLFISDPQGLVPIVAFTKYAGPWLKTIDSIIILRPVKPVSPEKKALTNRHMRAYLITSKRGRDFEIDSAADVNHHVYNSQYLYIVKPSSSTDSVLIYYSEDDASSACCDIKPDTNTLTKYINNFEKKYHVTVGRIFTYTYGDEGENTKYLTLSGLTQEQRINFIDERILSVSPDHIAPTVYRPFWISVAKFNHLQKRFSEPHIDDPNMIFMSVENPPYYPKGRKAFEEYIYRKMNLPSPPDAPIIISFVVNKDGTLTDEKIGRGTNDQLNQKILYIISHSSKWKPGINNGKAVRVKYTMSLYNLK